MKMNGLGKLAAVLPFLIASNNCMAAWPAIIPVSGTVTFDKPSSAVLSRDIFGKDGRRLYNLTCKNGDVADDKDFNYSGLFHCRLSVIGAAKQESHSLLFEGRTSTSDWEGRARFLLNDALGSCGNYHDWGRVRTFLVRGMRIILKIDHVSVGKALGEIEATSFSFSYDIKPDKHAISQLSEPSPIKEPPWFNGGDVCINRSKVN